MTASHWIKLWLLLLALHVAGIVTVLAATGTALAAAGGVLIGLSLAGGASATGLKLAERDLRRHGED